LLLYTNITTKIISILSIKILPTKIYLYNIYYIPMKLTKLHIFIIILIALILCPTLGACSVEGFVNTTFPSYGGSNGLNKSLDTSTMAGNPNYVSSYNTGYSPPRNGPRMMGMGANNSNGNGNSGGNNQGWLAWFKSLF
jgi:hypothetical protein